jgi:biofilm PGA synthesis N-glycosyltransferase PgaC
LRLGAVAQAVAEHETPHLADGLTVLVPAYNEAGSIGDTLLSLQSQTMAPDEIVVIDDCSSDGTAGVAESFGATVIRPPQNTGSKAGAQTYALAQVRTGMVMAIDADTTLAPDAIERLMYAFEDP